jgi:uncharacterized delta-60 repeat protein
MSSPARGVRRTLTLVTVMVAVLGRPTPGWASAAGSFDPSFGSGGVVHSKADSPDPYASGVAVQSDGRIIEVGQSASKFLVMRFNPNGTIDTSFGTGGRVLTSIKYFAGAHAVAIQGDGKIVVAGDSFAKLNSTANIALVRYNTDGSLDTSFGAAGVVVTSVPGAPSDAYAISIQTDQKIVVGGWAQPSSYEFAVVRYNTDGSLDSSFGTGGIVTTPVGSYASGEGLAIGGDGTIVIAGQTIGEFALARYNTDGSLDTTFGSGGIVTTPGTDVAHDVAILPSGEVLAVGEAHESGHTYPDVALVLYATDGTLDTSFGSGGKKLTPVGFSSGANSVALQGNGKIVVGGNSDLRFFLARFNGDGSRDRSFGNNGVVSTSINSIDGMTSVAIQSDGKIIGAGTSPGSSPTAFEMIRVNGQSRATTTLSISAPSPVTKGTKIAVRGYLASKHAACVGGQTVELVSKSLQLGTSTTGARGSYRFALVIHQKMTLKVTYLGDNACSPSASVKRTVKVS